MPPVDTCGGELLQRRHGRLGEMPEHEHGREPAERYERDEEQVPRALPGHLPELTHPELTHEERQRRRRGRRDHVLDQQGGREQGQRQWAGRRQDPYEPHAIRDDAHVHSVFSFSAVGLERSGPAHVEGDTVESSRPASRRASAGAAAGPGGHGVGGPVLFVDGRIDTGWTMTMAAVLLRHVGALAVLPFALAVTV
ncbi:hypothetical protein AB0K60_12950 [Thermopolyspora sp. NPDC052614]|uniref:hypothetical protein n=1 Tax=Thermopolyspora sp. NPDC052614 TaxID=3155682 RepID=UPI0034127D1B